MGLWDFFLLAKVQLVKTTINNSMKRTKKTQRIQRFVDNTMICIMKQNLKITLKTKITF